jgi:hypothetical protein
MPATRSTYRRKHSSTASFFAMAIAAMILSFGLLAGVRFMDRSQELRQRASQGQTVKLRLHGETVQPGELRIDFLLNSLGYNVAGTQVTATLTGAAPNEVSIDLNNSLNLERVGSRVTAKDGGSYIEFTQFAPLDSSKPVNTNGQEKKIASIYVKKSSGGTFTLSLNNASTSIPVVGDATIRTEVVGTQTFTLIAAGTGGGNQGGTGTKKSCNQNCATDTECQSQYMCYKGQCRLSENREDSSCRGIGDQGIHRTCNEYCADKNECASGYSCYFNRCRNPRNLGNTSCANPASPKPRTQVVIVPAATPSIKPTISPSASASASPSAVPSPSADVYDEGRFRVSPSPTIRKPSPTPLSQTSSQSSIAGRLARAGLILLFALVVVIPAGIYLYRRSR